MTISYVLLWVKHIFVGKKIFTQRVFISVNLCLVATYFDIADIVSFISFYEFNLLGLYFSFSAFNTFLMYLHTIFYIIY